MTPTSVNYNYYENGYPSGVFQIISGYYKVWAKQYGYGQDIFDPYNNAGVAAALFKDGKSYLWECH